MTEQAHASDTKLYQHDCDKCEYLGTFARYDLYRCRELHPTEWCLLARHGNEGSQYASMTDFGGKAQAAVKAYTGNLDDRQVAVLALFRMMPSLILNRLRNLREQEAVS